jgi:hypothetical protein
MSQHIRLQCSDAPGWNAAWTNVGLPIIGMGAEVVLIGDNAASNNTRFYRVQAH